MVADKTEGAVAAGPESEGANRFGRVSELRLGARVRDGRTVVPEMFATMPYKVMHPFAVVGAALPGLDETQHAKPAEVMVMSVSAGIMAGDRQLMDVEVASGAALRVTNQAFEKIHRMEGDGAAERETRIRVASGAWLDYAPLPQVPFADSSFAARTHVELADASARFIYSEILSCGRAARGERFAYRRYRNRVRIDVAGAPVFIDNTDYRPTASGGVMDMETTGFYEGFTHLANLVLVNLQIDDERFAAARAYLLEQTGVIGAAAAGAREVPEGDAVAGGITRLESGDCLVKVLGCRAQRLQEILEGVRACLA